MKENILPPREVLTREDITTAEFADLLNISTRRVQQLTTDGVFTRKGRGFYRLESILEYVQYLQEIVQSRKALADSQDGALNPEQERARKDAATADKLEMDLAERRGELLKATDAEEEWTKAVMSIRAGVLSLPSRVAEELARTKDARQVKERLRVEVYQILEELADYGDEEPDRMEAPPPPA